MVAEQLSGCYCFNLAQRNSSWLAIELQQLVDSEEPIFNQTISSLKPAKVICIKTLSSNLCALEGSEHNASQ